MPLRQIQIRPLTRFLRGSCERWRQQRGQVGHLGQSEIVHTSRDLLKDVPRVAWLLVHLRDLGSELVVVTVVGVQTNVERILNMLAERDTCTEPGLRRRLSFPQIALS